MWNPPRGYKGLRTQYRHAVKVDIHISGPNYKFVISEMINWCEEHCRYNWSLIDRTFWFDKTNEAIMFKMIFWWFVMEILNRKVVDLLRPYHVYGENIYEQYQNHDAVLVVESTITARIKPEIAEWIDNLNEKRFIKIKYIHNGIVVPTFVGIKGRSYINGLCVRFHRKSDVMMFKLAWS